ENPAPTLADYEAAGVEGVTEANLDAVNEAVVGVEDPVTTEAVQNLVTGVLEGLAAEAQTAALAKIAAYAEDQEENPAPTLADYEAAGVEGVTEANLDAVN
ncbi:hypothetical protein RZS08_67140, partial [Arthrospira platensis SPKY1]|nr:hypothetical protein [Arthrospira platensis SPKY1]